MSDKYELLRESLHELQREASARGGNNPRSQMILDLLADHEALQAECDRLNSYYKNGIDCFANPCEMHSGERTPPFSEFFERYGGRCLICVVDNNKALQAENERLRRDADRIEWLEAQTKKSYTGISFDYHRHVEDGYVVNHGYRFMRRHFASGFKDSLRKAIDAAMKEDKP